MLDGVAHQIGDDPAQGPGIRLGDEGVGRADLHLEPRRLQGPGQPQQALDDLLDQVHPRHLGAVGLPGVVAQPGVLEDLLHQGSQAVGVADRRAQVVALGRVEGGGGEHLLVAAHRRQGRAQVVGEVGDELAVAALVAAQPGAGPLGLRDRGVDLHHQRLHGSVHQLDVDRRVDAGLPAPAQLIGDGAQLAAHQDPPRNRDDGHRHGHQRDQHH